MKKTVRAIMIALCVMLTGAFCACGGGGGIGGGGFNKGQTTKLNIWITSVNQPQYFLGYFKSAFEKDNPGITLNFVVQSNDKLSGGLDASLSGRDAPDMASTWGGNLLNSTLSGNQILQIDDVMNGYEESMFDSALLNKYQGHHYCAPIFGFTSPTVFYNKTVFDQNGISVPTTYEELVSVCNKISGIKNAGGSSRYEPMVTGYSYHFMMGLHGRTCTRETLIKVINASATDKGVYDDEGFLNGFRWLEDMVKDGVFATNISGYNESTAANAFSLQKALMIATTSLDLLALSDSSQFEIGAFLLPDAPAKYKPTYGEGATDNGLVSGIYTDSLVINANISEEKREACKKVINYLYSKEAQSKLFNYYLYPARKDVDYSGVDANVKSVFDSTLKGIYEKASEEGMGVFYMSYYAKDGMMGNLEAGAKQVMNGFSPATGYGTVKNFVDA